MEIRNRLPHIGKLSGTAKLPLVELAGTKRILIENHMGILAYSPEEIQIKVEYGGLLITGNGLKFTELCKEQLVITGHIDTIRLHRR